MINHFKTIVLVFLIMFLPSSVFGDELSPKKYEAIQESVLESKSSWDRGKQGASYTESDVLIELGVEAHAEGGDRFVGDDIFNQSLFGGSTNSFLLNRQGSTKILCEPGAIVQLASLEVKVLACQNGQYEVAMCDALSFGHSCSEHNTHIGYLDTSGGKQVFKQSVFNGKYQLKTTCLDGECHIHYKAVYQQEFSSTSIGSKNQGDQAAVDHAATGSVLNDVSSIYDPADPELAEVRKDVQGNKNQHIDCYSERMNELNSDGLVRQSCDPDDTRTFDFETEISVAEDVNLENEAPDNSAALAKVIAEGEKAKALSSAFAGNMSEDADGNITIFNGRLKQCNKYSIKFFDYIYWPVNLPFYTVFETFLGGLDKDKRNCCVGLPEDINTTVNAGNCTQDDIKLAAKRLAGAAHLIQLAGATPVESGHTSYGEDFQEVVPYDKKCYEIGVDKWCSVFDVIEEDEGGEEGGEEGDKEPPCLSYVIDVSVDVPGYKTYQQWPADKFLSNKVSELTKILEDKFYFVDETKHGVPSSVCNHVLFDPSCGSSGCDRTIKTDEDNKDYFETEKCACEEVGADGSCLKLPKVCRVYPNEEEVDLVGVDDVDSSGNWLPGRFEACAFWTRYSTPLFGLFMKPGSGPNKNSSEELHKLALKPHICKEYIWDVVERIPVDHYQSWCTFDDPFARIIQEQGRKQLALYATLPETGAVTDVVEFGFYTPVVGSWTPAKIINKQDVRFWQWPHSCTEASVAAKADVTDQSCPNNADVYIAVCSREGTCGSLPSNPALQASSKWEIRLLRGEDTGLNTLTPLLVLKGGCTNSGLCKYNLHAWSKSVAGSVDVPIDMNWALKGLNSGWKVNYNSHNQVHLMAYTSSLYLNKSNIFDFEINKNQPIGSIPTPKLKICFGSPLNCNIDDVDDEDIWKIVELDSPTEIDGQEINDSRLTNDIHVKAFGQCNPKTLNCAYRIVANIKLEAKPWHRGITYDKYKSGIKPKIFGKYIGGKKTQYYNHQLKADCSGFTLEQFLALNLTAMDLREFTDIISTNVENKIDGIASGSSSNVQTDANKIMSGSSTTVTGTGTKNFRIYPDNGYPGAEAKLQPLYMDEDNSIGITKNAKLVKYKVSSYTVNWEGRPHTIYTYSPEQTPTYIYGHLEKQSIGETLLGSVTWHTDGGDITENFTYKIWFNPNEASGGGKIDTKESLDSPIKQFDELDNDFKKLDPQNW